MDGTLNRLMGPLLVVLVLVCAYQTWQITQLKSEQNRQAAELLNANLANCIDRANQALINEVPAALLANQLLDDSAEVAAYLDAFDPRSYQVSAVHGIGSFYLDEQKDAIKDVLRQGHIWEPLVVAQIMKYARPGTVAIDAGAHIGSHTLMLSRHVGPNGRVYAFEPQRKVYRELYYNMQLNSADNVRPLRVAVGDTSGVIEMDPTLEGNEGGTHVGSGGDKAELRTIDSFGFTNVSLIKIDVEHMEDQVIDGARQTILDNRPAILVEIQGGYDYDKVSEERRAKIDHTINKLVELGYGVTRFSGYDYLALPVEDRS